MKRYGIVAALCLALIGITACGDAAEEAETGEKQTESEAEVKEVELWDSEKELEGKLDITFFYEEYQQELMIQAFMEANPGVTINVHTIVEEAISTAEEYREAQNRLATMIMSEDTSDIYETTNVSGIKFFGNGYFEDLYPYMSQDLEFDSEDYYMNILEACESNGCLYQCPEGFYYMMVRLNKNILEQLDYEVPETINYKDIYELYVKAKEKGLVDDDFILDEHAYLYVYLRLAEQMLYINSDSKQADLDSEEFVEFLQTLMEMNSYNPKSSYIGFAETRKFSNDKCLLSMFPSYLSESSVDLFEETDTATAPILLSSSDGRIPFIRVGSYWSICSGSENKALAWEFIKFCIKEKELDFYDSSSNNYFRNYFTYGQMINKANSRQIAEYYFGDDKNSLEKLNECYQMINAQSFEDAVLGSYLEEYFFACMNGELTPEECAQQMQQRAYAYVNE